MAGHATSIDVTIDGRICRVQDDGRGIPCEIHPVTGKSTLETVLCVLHAGGKFGGQDSGYRVSGGLHGVGLSVVNALSQRLDVRVYRDETMYEMHFERGKPLGTMTAKKINEKNSSGTCIEFEADPEIFKESTRFDLAKLASRMDELAYLNAGLSLSLTSEKFKEKKKVFQHLGGIAELRTKLCGEKTLLHPSLDTFLAKGESADGTILVECALAYCKEQYSELIVSFANGIKTTDGGTHLEGLRSCLTRIINAAAKKTNKQIKASIPGEYIREGLVAVLSIKLIDPEFEGQTKTKLNSPLVRQVVEAIVGEELNKLFEWQPKALTAIIDKATAAQSAANAARAARDIVRRKSAITSTVLPGKLADCAAGSSWENTEIFVVEGDSAAGSAKLGRDRTFQAILPLRGKVLNIEKCAAERIYQNTELQALISALGLGVRGESLNVQNLRYNRIIIMTDADIDGAHIRVLLLTFFYRYQRELIEQGHVYNACPPLYKVSIAKKIHYCWSDEELDTLIASTNSTPMIQRFKGLGEMMPQQLWETTMDPATRKLQKIALDDVISADRTVSLLMGDSVVQRKDFISSQSLALDTNDVVL
eukprot:CAMPEP_0197309024 /NCGR_PEP_ID=MMETSP0891-20130614/7576_1 /TAXON_ID=44058 ORGANISM="Aureoumbra lagunensis, Strain CCMP1510" /NCGR_SAMPLE_ID=MMETSP0891 /ASSEMBLY_ACC=CAM_ASM_000534 /LENGTH=592 /DNA_ID=CAMNT_0042793871 /DNA_START=192 /DNA_END=1970 /DNA_ORIENTATION=+